MNIQKWFLSILLLSGMMMNGAWGMENEVTADKDKKIEIEKKEVAQESTQVEALQESEGTAEVNFTLQVPWKLIKKGVKKVGQPKPVLSQKRDVVDAVVNQAMIPDDIFFLEAGEKAEHYNVRAVALDGGSKGANIVYDFAKHPKFIAMKRWEKAKTYTNNIALYGAGAWFLYGLTSTWMSGPLSNTECKGLYALATIVAAAAVTGSLSGAIKNSYSTMFRQYWTPSSYAFVHRNGMEDNRKDKSSIMMAFRQPMNGKKIVTLLDKGGCNADDQSENPPKIDMTNMLHVIHDHNTFAAINKFRNTDAGSKFISISK